MTPNCLKKHLLYFFTLLLFINCSNEDDSTPVSENNDSQPQTELMTLTGDNNQLTLSWRPVEISNFVRYKVYRLDSYTDNYINPNVIVYSGELIFQTNNRLDNVYVDHEVPFNSFVHYAVVTEYIDEDNTHRYANSINHLSYENEDLSFEVTSLEKLADGSLKLTWEEDNNSGFEKYTIAVINTFGVSSSEDIFNSGQILNTTVNQTENSTSDTNQYQTNKLHYAVSKVINGKTIFSKNFLSIDNPRSFNFTAIQTLKNPYNENEIIIIDRDGAVVFYDINSLSSTRILTNIQNFFSSIGSYNGVYDLYVPSAQGKVFVIDLVTHAVKETISLNTDPDMDIISAIPINNHLLFLEKHHYADGGGMFVYDRLSNNVINRNGSFTMHSNSKLVYAQENYFFFLWNDGLEYGSDSAIRRLNINGNTVSVDMLWSESKSDSRLFALSDDKSFFVSTNFGHHSNVNYQNFTETTTQKYSQSPNFGDAKIFENNQIFFSLPNDSRIEVFEKNNFGAPINQYPTIGKPLFIEVFQNKIVSLNQFENTYYIQTITR